MSPPVITSKRTPRFLFGLLVLLSSFALTSGFAAGSRRSGLFRPRTVVGPRTRVTATPRNIGDDSGSPSTLPSPGISKAYNNLQYIYLAAFLGLLLIPSPVSTAVASSSPNTNAIVAKCAGASGNLLAAGICRILATAPTTSTIPAPIDTEPASPTTNAGDDDDDTIIPSPEVSSTNTSEEWDGLRWGLLWFSGLGGIWNAGPWISRGWRTALAAAAFGMALNWTTAAVSFLDLRQRRTLQASSGVREFLRERLKSFRQSFVVDHPIKSRTYRNIYVLLLFRMISTLMELTFTVRYLNSSLSMSRGAVSLQGSVLARLGLVTTTVATLQKAADRDALDDPHFIGLNALLGVGWIGWLALVHVTQFLVHDVPSHGSRGALCAALSIPFLAKAAKGMLDRKDKQGTSSSSTRST